jgi:DNA-binding response OmpR family regulator
VAHLVVTRVLVVEDDPVVRKAVAEYLEDEGYDVGAVDTLDGAREFVTQSMPDLLVLDLLLADRSGAELLAELACRGDAPATVILSASPAASEVARRYRLPMLKKPFDLDVLADTLRAAVAAPTRTRAQTVM